MTRTNSRAEILGERMGEEPFEVREYLQILWFRRRLITALTLFTALIGLVQVNEIKSVYTASASLMIGVSEARIVNVEQVLARDYYGESLDAEVEVLRSRGLARRVIESLSLLNNAEFNPALRVPEKRFFDFLRYLDPRTWIPQDWKRSVREAVRGEIEQIELSEEERKQKLMEAAINQFLGRLKLERIMYTNVVTIGFNANDPKLAARVANEIPEAYIVDQLRAKFDASAKATEWLAAQLEEQRQKVAESERAVEIYRETHGLSQGSGTTLLAEQVSELNSQLIVVRAQRIDIETRLEQVNRLLLNDGQGVESSVEVRASPLVQELLKQEAEVTGRASELGVEFGPKHPRMLQINAEKTDIRQRIKAEIEKIALGLANELELTRNREQSLATSLRETSAQTGAQSRQAIQLRALEREAAADRALFETFLNRLKETSSTEDIQSSNARVISSAAVPSSPSYPNRERMVLYYLFGGLLMGSLLAFALHSLNPGLLTPEQVEKELGIHTIGLLPSLPSSQDPYQHMLSKQPSAFTEALNSLKISLQLSDPDDQFRTLQITSSLPEEGKSTLALSLAMTMASTGKRVLLVDADLRRKGVERYVKLPEKHQGLTDLVINPEGEIEDYVVTIESAGIDFMYSGDARNANAADLFSSGRVKHLVSLLKQKYDHILFDAPPVMAVADARVISKLVDKTLFVVRWDKTPRKVAQAALEQLRKDGSYISGIVLQQINMARYGRLSHGNSGYYYHHSRYHRYYQS